MLAALVSAYLMVITLGSVIKNKFVTTVAGRHLRSRGICAVAIGLISILVVLYLLIISVLEGFKEHYMDKLQNILAHETVNVGNLAWGIQRPEEWAGEISKVDPQIKGVSIGLETPALVQFDKARTIGTLRGIDLERELKYGRLKEILWPNDVHEFGMHEHGGKQVPGCIVGGAWRKSYDLQIGGLVTFAFTDEDEEVRSVAFQIVGFYEGKNPYLEQGAYADRKLLAEKIKVPGMAKTLFVWMNDPNRPDLYAVRDKIKARMKELIARDAPRYPNLINQVTVETWQEKDNNFYQAITRENLLMRFIMGIFLCLMAFIVYLIFGRLVAEKVRDIGVLRALGATPAGIRGCFLAQGLFIGCLGVLAGLIISYFFIGHVNTIANACGIDPFPNDSFGVVKIPTRTLPWDVYLISAVTVFSALVGAFIPAYRASKLDPVECLRHE